MTTPVDTEITLRDGTVARLRPIRQEDDQVLVESFRQLSPESVYQRFFTALPELTEGMARYLTHLHSDNRFALVAEIGSELAAVARYERTSDPEVVELGLVVLDRWQNRGLGRIMLRRILDAAAQHGIRKLRADVLAENRRMMRLLMEEAKVYDRKIEAGVVTFLMAA